MTTKKFDSDFDERGLLPYPVIVAATKGDPDAMKIVLQTLRRTDCRFVCPQNTVTNAEIHISEYDEDIRDRLRSRLMRAVLDFQV